MTLSEQELAILKTPLGPRYYDRLERLIAELRGFGIQWRGLVSGGRGIEAGFVITDSVTNRWKMNEGSGTNLSDTESSQSATLNNGGNWDSNSKYTGGVAPTFDTVDDWWITDAKFGINNQQFSVCGWINVDNWTDYAAIVDASTSNNDSSTDSPWRFRDNGGSGFRLTTEDGEITSTYFSPDTDGTDYFFGIAGDGYSFDTYVWDSSSQVYNQSGTASRSTSNEYLRGMAMGSDYVGGTADAWFVSTTDVLTKREFEMIWQETNR